MKLTAARSRTVRIPLTRPYAVSGGSWDAVELVLVELEADDGSIGYGQASPAEEVTGETIASVAAELEPQELEWLLGLELAEFGLALTDLQTRVKGPAARAAVDMALFDLEAKRQKLPVVEMLMRSHPMLPTSITIGLKGVEETLAEADEYVARGFRLLKVKIGESVELDLERLAKLRERHGAAIVLRADANQGYDLRALARFCERMEALDIELLEQPTRPELDAELMAFPKPLRDRFVADESVHDEHGLKRLQQLGLPYGGINIKLMKTGGLRGALRLARLAERAKLKLMWGCMDESVLGIAAALHGAFANPATTWLDLDGSFDLAEDPFFGGFSLDGDRLSTLAAPGLGVEPRA